MPIKGPGKNENYHMPRKPISFEAVFVHVWMFSLAFCVLLAVMLLYCCYIFTTFKKQENSTSKTELYSISTNLSCSRNIKGRRAKSVPYLC